MVKIAAILLAVPLGRVMEAVKRIKRTGEPASRIAAEMGVNKNTKHGWVKR